MSELLFTLKTFVFAAILVALMQIRVSGQTIESKAEQWLETSKVAHYLQSSAAGGVLAVKDLYRSVVGSWTGSSKSHQVKASK